MSQNNYSHTMIDGVRKTVHRHVMEVHLARELGHDEHVYHINGDSKDNRIENLVLVKKTYNNPIKTRKKSKLEVLEEQIEELRKRLNLLEGKNG